MKLFTSASILGCIQAACTGTETFDDSVTSCTAGSMKVSISKCAFENARFTDPTSSYIAGPNYASKLTVASDATNQCEPVENGEFYDFTVSADLEECGSEVVNDGTTVTYKNAAQLIDGKENSFISRIRRMKVDFECSFDLKVTLSAVEVARPTVTHYEVSLGKDHAAFTVSMGLYTDNTFTGLQSGPLTVDVPEPIYVGIHLTGTDEFVVTMDNCWATATSDPSDTTKYEFITNQCGDLAELNDYQTLVIYATGTGQKASFSMNAFSFNGITGGGEIYFHCDAIICDPDNETCVPTCPSGRRRKRRNTIFDNHVITSVGPIQVTQHEDKTIH